MSEILSNVVPVRYQALHEQAKKSRAAAVRIHCLYCQGWDRKACAECVTVECPLYAYWPGLKRQGKASVRRTAPVAWKRFLARVAMGKGMKDAVKAFCAECVGWQDMGTEIPKCKSKTCPLWPYRGVCSPSRAHKATEKQLSALAESVRKAV